MSRIYLSPPHMGDSEFQLFQSAFQSNWIAPVGPDVDAFEREVASYVGVRAACAVSCGTAALHLALRCLGIGRGDLVLCSTLTFCASANPIVYQGAEPVFVDSDEATWNLSPKLLREELHLRARIGTLPKAIIVVDLFGQCADYDVIVDICNEHGVVVIEDAAESLGARYRSKRAGALGRCSVLSFNGNKILTTSSGGMLLSDDVELIAQAKFLSTQARDPAPHYQHTQIGYNYRMSNLLAAIGRGQMRVLDERVEARRGNYDHYRGALSELPGIAFMPEAAYGLCTHWLTVITIDPERFGATREDVRLALEAENIESRPVWKPLHLQPAYSSFRAVGGSVSERLFDDGLCLPSGSALTAAERDRVIAIVRGMCRR